MDSLHFTSLTSVTLLTHSLTSLTSLTHFTMKVWVHTNSVYTASVFATSRARQVETLKALVYTAFTFTASRLTLARFVRSPTIRKILAQNLYWVIRHFCTHFSENRPTYGEFDFRGATLQFVQNIKPIRQLLCTFSSCSDKCIYMIYNIYKFQEK